MKILVGILHCIENEFGDCIESIEAQTLKTRDHFILSNLPNKDAHDTLYRTFMDRAQDFDLFIKIDADMVLARPRFFEEVAQHFNNSSDLSHLIVAVHDWFTDKSIMGLHVYRSDYRWEVTSETLFVDVFPEIGKVEKDRSQLAPAALHCPNPSPFQAFHYGVHKGTKFLQSGTKQVAESFRDTHWRHFKSINKHISRNRDRRLLLTKAGFIHALKNDFGAPEVQYDSKRTREAFEFWDSLSNMKIKTRLLRFGPIAWPLVPNKLKRIAANSFTNK